MILWSKIYSCVLSKLTMNVLCCVWMQQSGSAFDSAGADSDFPEAKGSVEGSLQEEEIPSFGSASQEDQSHQKALN